MKYENYALSDIVHDGVLLPAGTAVAMLWGSPGFDPEGHSYRWQPASSMRELVDFPIEMRAAD